MYTCRIAFASHRHRFRYIRSSIKRKVRNRRSNIVSKIAAKKRKKRKTKRNWIGNSRQNRPEIRSAYPDYSF